MPSGRRLPRTARAPVPPALIPLVPSEVSNNRYLPLGTSVPTLPGLEQPCAPKHIPFPSTPVENEIIFEFLTFLYASLSASLQFLHLYRSIWWLPHSYTKQSVNFYLIDKHLVAFIIVLFSRRLLYVLGCKVIGCIVPLKIQELTTVTFRLILFGFITGFLTWCAYCVVQNHAVVNIFYLCYPVSVYLILFGFNITPFFELIKSEDVPPLHACTSNTSEIRSEVENLKANFNDRMKQILFCSVLTGYYAGFIPCCFVQSFLYYDVYWASQHVVFIWLGCFSSYTIHVLPLRYCDTLHRSALHLGCWDKMESRSHLPVAYCWQEDMLWPSGALVRYGRDIYRAQGESNAAEPGNAAYSRFYNTFKNPSIALSGVLGLQVSLVLFQLAVLFRCSYWYHIVSVTLLIFFNYYTLFKVARDYLVSLKIYKAEQAMQNKINNN